MREVRTRVPWNVLFRPEPVFSDLQPVSDHAPPGLDPETGDVSLRVRTGPRDGVLGISVY